MAKQRTQCFQHRLIQAEQDHQHAADLILNFYLPGGQEQEGQEYGGHTAVDVWQAFHEAQLLAAAKVTDKTSDDPGSYNNGGLYENIYKGQMRDAFDAWVFDAARQPGDHGIVETDLGYHIMFFSAHRDWFVIAKEGLIDDIAFDKIPETAEKYESQVDFSLVQLGKLNLA